MCVNSKPEKQLKAEVNYYVLHLYDVIWNPGS